MCVLGRLKLFCLGTSLVVFIQQLATRDQPLARDESEWDAQQLSALMRACSSWTIRAKLPRVTW